MKKLSIIIPMYNEEESLPHLYERLIKLADNIPNYKLEFLFVNDGSKDSSLDIVKSYRVNDKRVCYLNLSRNFGKEVAMGAAFDYVTGDAVAIIDADLQDPPELIVEMIKEEAGKGKHFLKSLLQRCFIECYNRYLEFQFKKIREILDY